MSNYNDNFTSIKYRGQTFVQWCKDNNYEYMIDEIDEVYLYNNYGKTKETLNRGFDKNIRFVCKNGHELKLGYVLSVIASMIEILMQLLIYLDRV